MNGEEPASQPAHSFFGPRRYEWGEEGLASLMGLDGVIAAAKVGNISIKAAADSHTTATKWMETQREGGDHTQNRLNSIPLRSSLINIQDR
jgi:hypothetical protein